MIDLGRYPRAAAYLARLPHGLDSYPECTSKGSLVDAFYAEMRARSEIPRDLPAPLQQWAEQRPAPGSWVAEVHARTLALITYDHLGFTDDEAVRWVFDRNRELLDGRTYRAISLVAFPALLVRGAGLRWNLFHRGSELTTGRAFDQYAVTLVYPPDLFDELSVRGFGESLRAIMMLSRATDVSVTLESRTDRAARYRVDWTRAVTASTGRAP